MKSIEENASENVIKMLIGNKKDMTGSRKISYEEGKKVADQFNM